MRGQYAKVLLAAVLLVGVFGAATLPAHADTGSPFNPGDNRISPMTGDLVAVYCNAADVDVWSVDPMSTTGAELTDFNLADLTSKAPVTHKTATGNVTLSLVSPATTHWGYASGDTSSYGLIVDQGAVYDVNWVGRFDKTFSCTYMK